MRLTKAAYVHLAKAQQAGTLSRSGTLNRPKPPSAPPPVIDRKDYANVATPDVAAVRAARPTSSDTIRSSGGGSFKLDVALLAQVEEDLERLEQSLEQSDDEYDDDDDGDDDYDDNDDDDEDDEYTEASESGTL